MIQDKASSRPAVLGACAGAARRCSVAWVVEASRRPENGRAKPTAGRFSPGLGRLTGAPIVVWFRRDLRLADNPALAAACARGRPVIPLFILEPRPEVRPIGAASAWWLEKSLRSLAADMEAAGSRLVLRRGPAVDEIAALIQETGAGAVMWNEVFQPGWRACDAAVARALGEAGAEARSFNGGYLTHPDRLRTKAGGPFQVFTPFWRAARAQLSVAPPAPRPRRIAAPAAWPVSDRLEAWRLHPTAPDWSSGFEWTPGEASAQAALETFAEGALRGYATARDLPGVAGTSRLSPHLQWGEISPHAVWRRAMAAAEAGEAPDSQVDSFVAELGWREFCAHLAFHDGDLAQQNYDRRFDGFPWRSDPAALRAWRRGRTGYPIVDAGMRQLWATGWMHNRVRMIVASFLTKHLLIDWREGERWFWDTLVDADHASNAGNWQWVAGSGADAAPYFRIFNPMTQGEKFDPPGDYVRRWVPELANLPARHVHAPWRAPPAILSVAGVRLGETYPEPLVEHAGARQRALDAYGRMRSASAIVEK